MSPEEVADAIDERDSLRDLLRSRGGMLFLDTDSEDEAPRSQLMKVTIPAMPRRGVLVKFPIRFSVGVGLTMLRKGAHFH